MRIGWRSDDGFLIEGNGRSWRPTWWEIRTEGDVWIFECQSPGGWPGEYLRGSAIGSAAAAIEDALAQLLDD